MELSEYVESLRRELAAVTRVAGDEVARAGELLGDALDSAVRLTLLDVLSGAAAEITSQMSDAVVEVRLGSGGLGGGEATFVVVGTPGEPEPEAPPPPAAADEEDSGTARVTLRLPDALKGRMEAVASREGVSVNAWLIRAVGRAVDNPAGPAASSARRGPGQRITGFARS
jgi:hypothetical protein